MNLNHSRQRISISANSKSNVSHRKVIIVATFARSGIRPPPRPVQGFHLPAHAKDHRLRAANDDWRLYDSSWSVSSGQRPTEVRSFDLNATGGTWTHTILLSRDFKSLVSAIPPQLQNAGSGIRTLTPIARLLAVFKTAALPIRLNPAKIADGLQIKSIYP